MTGSQTPSMELGAQSWELGSVNSIRLVVAGRRRMVEAMITTIYPDAPFGREIGARHGEAVLMTTIFARPNDAELGREWTSEGEWMRGGWAYD